MSLTEMQKIIVIGEAFFCFRFARAQLAIIYLTLHIYAYLTHLLLDLNDPLTTIVYFER